MLRQTLLVCALAGLALGADDVGRPIVNPRPGIINLRTGDVDAATLVSVLPAPAFAPVPHLLQLDGPMDSGRAQSLAAAGVRIMGYLPTNFFLADVSAATPARVRALPWVLGAFEYQRAWKLDPTLGAGANAHPWQTPARQALAQNGDVAVKVWLFSGAAPEPFRASLRATPGVTITSEELVGSGVSFGLSLPPAALAPLADDSQVQFIEEFPEYTARSNSVTRWVVQSNVSGVTPLYTAGLTGVGQIMGIIDGWVSPTHCAFSDPVNPIGPSHRKILAYNTDPSYDAHGTHVACTALGDNGINGDLRGIAYGAKMVFNIWPDVTESSNYDRFNLHYTQGARVHSNSWGADWIDAYDGGCRAIDMIQYQHDENLIVHAVSNSTLVHNPENAKNSMAVAASGNYPNQNTMCSGGAGPTQDGRRKPEITAPGCSINSARGDGGCSTGVSSGTSMATPAAAGVATLTRQYYMAGFYPSGSAHPADGFEPSGALIKATVINSAQDMTGVPDYPNNREGWGRVLADASLYFAGDARKLMLLDVHNNTDDALATGDAGSLAFNVADPALSLRLTMVYHDAPAEVNASFAPVNNLDLTLIDPAGNVYLGNNFSGGYSSRGGAADIRNNTEQIHISSPQIGTWHAYVSATAVNTGRQGYALVVTGAVGAPPCIADFNVDGGVDGADVEAFFAAWEAGDASADIDVNGGVDGADVEAFFLAWEQGC